MALPPTPTTVPVSHGSGLQYRSRSCSLVFARLLTSAFAPLSTTSQHAVHWSSRSFCLDTVFVRIVKFVSVRDCHGRSHTCKLGHVHFGSPAESFPAFSGYAVFLGQKYPSFAPTPQLCFALLFITFLEIGISCRRTMEACIRLLVMKIGHRCLTTMPSQSAPI